MISDIHIQADVILHEYRCSSGAISPACLCVGPETPELLVVNRSAPEPPAPTHQHTRWQHFVNQFASLDQIAVQFCYYMSCIRE